MSHTPTIASATSVAPSAVPLQSSPPFYLVARPQSPYGWMVMCGRVVPALRKLMLVEGANGVSTGRDGAGRPAPNPRHALDDARERGEVVVPWDVDGPGTSYIRRVPNTNAWVTRWETAYAGTDRVTTDSEGYAQWAESLVTRGIVPAPPLYALQTLAADRQAIAVREALKRPDLAAGAQAELAVVRALLDRLEPAVLPVDDAPQVALDGEAVDEPAPAPAPRRRR